MILHDVHSVHEARKLLILRKVLVDTHLIAVRLLGQSTDCSLAVYLHKWPQGCRPGQCARSASKMPLLTL